MTTFNLAAFQQQVGEQKSKLPPIEKWDPDFCGDIDMQIKHDGSWFYMGTPIGRKALVTLFASVLKKENDAYFLVTPVEKVGIQVEDSPFIITEWKEKEGKLVLTTNLADTIIIGPENPVTLQQDRMTGATLPYALVRRNLWARLHQNVFYQLAEIGEESTINNQQHLTVKSGHYIFSLGEL